MSKDGFCWLDWLRNSEQGKDPLLLSVVYGLIIYFIASLPLIISGQGFLARQWLSPVILGAVGTSWSLLFYWVGSQDYKNHLSSLETALKPQSVDAYRSLKDTHIRNIGNNRNYFIGSIIIWVIGSILTLREIRGITPPGFLRVFPPEWLSPDLAWYRLATIVILGFPVILLICTLGVLLILHTVFLARISRLEYLPSQYVCYLRFRPLLWINILGAFGWSIGVALFVLLFRQRYGIGHITFVAILQAVATIIFFWPTWLFRVKLKQIGIERVDKLVAAAKGKLELLSTDDNAKWLELLSSEESKRWPDIFFLEDQMAKHITDFSFEIGWRYVGYVLTTFVLPVATAIIATILTKYVETAPK